MLDSPAVDDLVDGLGATERDRDGACALGLQSLISLAWAELQLRGLVHLDRAPWDQLVSQEPRPAGSSAHIHASVDMSTVISWDFGENLSTGWPMIDGVMHIARA